jgi:hypothetical protein
MAADTTGRRLRPLETDQRRLLSCGRDIDGLTLFSTLLELLNMRGDLIANGSRVEFPSGTVGGFFSSRSCFAFRELKTYLGGLKA